MLSRKEQLEAYDRVVAMCKGTKFEGREHLCVKFGDSTTKSYYSYTSSDGLDLTVEGIRIFAVAIVDDTPIWLEEPFRLYQSKDTRFTDMVFTYRAKDHKLIGTGRVRNTIGATLGNMKVAIPLDKVVWKNFTLTKPSKYVENSPMSLESPPIDRSKLDWWQVGGTHYKDKAIQPWAYMEANFTKEEFVGFLKGNALKYMMRFQDKNGVEDLKKAIHYIEKLVQVESEGI